MGRNGHVQVRAPEYGCCISDWAQSSFCDYLAQKHIEISTPGDEFCSVGDADRWEIQIPTKPMKGHRGWLERDYDKIRKLVTDLRKHPGKVCDDDGHPEGENAANVLEEGLNAAEKHRWDCITIEWF